MFWRIALPVFWVVCFAMTHYPRLTIPIGPESSDKWLHGSGFALLTFLFWRNFAAMGGVFSLRFVLIAVTVLLGYAAVDEFTQQFVQRSTDFYDWCADSTGVLATLAGLAILHGLRRARSQPHATVSGPAE